MLTDRQEARKRAPKKGALEDEGAWSHVGVGRKDSHTAESQPGMCELQEDSSGAECEEGGGETGQGPRKGIQMLAGQL